MGAVRLRTEDSSVEEKAQQIVIAQAHAASFIRELREGPLDDRQPVEELTAFLREVVYPLMEQVHESLDPVVIAANFAHKEAIRARAELLKPLEETVKFCKNALSFREERLRQAQESAKVSIDPEELTPTAPLPQVQGKGVQVRDSYSFTIEVPGAIKSPYMTPDLKKIQQAVNKHREHAIEIVGGIRVTKNPAKVTVRR